jgi:hypothetical protein
LILARIFQRITSHFRGIIMDSANKFVPGNKHHAVHMLLTGQTTHSGNMFTMGLKYHKVYAYQ